MGCILIKHPCKNIAKTKPSFWRNVRLCGWPAGVIWGFGDLLSVLISHCWMTTYSAMVATYDHTGCRLLTTRETSFSFFHGFWNEWHLPELCAFWLHALLMAKSWAIRKIIMWQWQHVISFLHLLSASFLLSQCWRKMTITSPESLNLPRRSHPFSQSAPTGLNRMGWPEAIPDIGELHASFFSFTLRCPGKKDKTWEHVVDSCVYLSDRSSLNMRNKPLSLTPSIRKRSLALS